MKTQTYLLLSLFCVSTPFIMAMDSLTPKQEKLLIKQDTEIRRILQEKDADLAEIFKFFGLSGSVRMQYMNKKVIAVNTNPASYGQIKILSVPEIFLKPLAQDTDEIKKLLTKKGIDINRILTKMGLDSSTIRLRFCLPGEYFGCSHALQTILVDENDLKHRTAAELTYEIGHECAHLKCHHKEAKITFAPQDRYDLIIIAPSIFLTMWLAFSIYKWPSSIFLHSVELVAALSALLLAIGIRSFFILKNKAHQEEYFADREATLRLNCFQGTISCLENDLEENKQGLAANSKLKNRILPDGNDKFDLFHPRLTDRIAAIKALQQQMQKPCS